MTPANRNLPIIRCPHCGMIDEFRKEIVTVTGEKEPSQKELVELFTWECRQCHQKYLLKYRFEYYDGTQIMPKWRSLETDMINPDDYGLQGIVDCEYEAVYPDDVKCKCDRCGKEVKLIEANYKDYCDSNFRTIISKIGDIAHFEIICGKCLRDMFMSHMFKDDTDIKTDKARWQNYYSWNNLWGRERSAFPCFFFKTGDSGKQHLQVTTGADIYNNVSDLIDFWKRYGQSYLEGSCDSIVNESEAYIRSIENLTGIKLVKSSR